jgi:hypothetical protein
MAHLKLGNTIMWGIGSLAACFLWLAGCYGSSYNKSSSSTPIPSQTGKGSAPLYYDFGDVLVPNEMKIDTKLSFVYRTPGFSAGVLTLKGRVEMNSLITFFETHMPKDNWSPVSSFKSQRTIMMFKKNNRWCVINITEKQFHTLAEVWVAPTTDESETQLSP